MALAESPLPVFLRGTWPGPLTLRRGWARAEARPWNDETNDATIRLVRGGAGFLHACAERLNGLGAPSVLSPPVSPGGRNTWTNAGFNEFVTLALMRRSLEEPAPSPGHIVVAGKSLEVAGLLDTDHAAFPKFWRFNAGGFREAMRATSRSAVFIIRGPDGEPVAFAIVGYGHAISYLQRVAVHPNWQGEGMGRSVVRAAIRSARTHGARAMLLNTQVDNEAAIGLYESEGFVTLPEPLAVFRRS